MKKILIVLSSVVVLIIVILVAVFFLTTGITKTADQFFRSVQNNDLEAAYGQLSEEFRASTSAEQFESFLKKSALLNGTKTSWSRRSISGKTGNVEGVVETADGGTIPIKITFVKEKGQWKILSISKTAAGVVQETGAGKTIPGEADLRKMTDDCMQDFASAVNKKDFTDFYGNFSDLWKSQITPGKLLEIFKGFVDQQVDLTVLSEYKAVFSAPPRINEDGFLELKGYYPTQPSTTYFTLKYKMTIFY